MSNPTEQMTLTEFLLARIAEDEADQDGGDFGWPESQWHIARCDVNTTYNARDCDCGLPARVLAECATKRAIVQDFATLDADYRISHSEFTEARRFQALVSLAQVAAVYADHPDYRDGWRP